MTVREYRVYRRVRGRDLFTEHEELLGTVLDDTLAGAVCQARKLWPEHLGELRVCWSPDEL